MSVYTQCKISYAAIKIVIRPCGYLTLPSVRLFRHFEKVGLFPHKSSRRRIFDSVSSSSISLHTYAQIYTVACGPCRSLVDCGNSLSLFLSPRERQRQRETVTKREREREGERQTDREIERQRHGDRQTDRQRKTETERQRGGRGREKERDRDGQRERAKGYALLTSVKHFRVLKLDTVRKNK